MAAWLRYAAGSRVGNRLRSPRRARRVAAPGSAVDAGSCMDARRLTRAAEAAPTDRRIAVDPSQSTCQEPARRCSAAAAGLVDAGERIAFAPGPRRRTRAYPGRVTLTSRRT